MKPRVLVVDDEPEVMDALVRALRIEGFDAEGVTDPFAAFEKVQKENFLIVVADIQMPGMRGTDLLKKIKEYNGMIQVIMITGFVTIDNILTCLRRGASDCFFKPLRKNDELFAAVHQAAEKLTRWEQVLSDLVHMKDK